ncbi:MAG TPA: FAD-dependent monooxygenase [Candidatus Binataceae bacterium]|nr:FAD-dependent monooxygenase [Candidatus Binataceae bacterium]
MSAMGEAAVLVVGAGPTGLMMASELVRHGLSCRIVDKAPAPSEHSKAAAIQAHTLEIFEALGIAERFVDTGVKVHGISAYSGGKRILHVTLDGLESRYNFALMLPQDQTERLLGEYASALGVRVERNVELVGLEQDGNAVTACLKGVDGEERARFQYLVGCDGAHSAVRHALNLAFEGAEYPEHFALADAHVDWIMPADEITGFFTESGMLMFFPFGGGRYRLMATCDEAPDHGEPSLADMQALVDSRATKGIRLHDALWLSYFRIHRRQAQSYRVNRVFLAGDACHIHSPAGGQGMNTGLQDAYNLGWKLALVLKGLGRAEILDSYSAERHAVGRAVLTATDLTTRIGALRSPVGMVVRSRLMAVLSGSEFLTQRAGRTLAELSVNYRKSPLVEDYQEGIAKIFASFAGGPAVGDRAPEVSSLRTEAGQEVGLWEMLRGTTHCLLLFPGVEAQWADYRELAGIGQRVTERYGQCVKPLLVVNEGGLPKGLGWSGATIWDSAHKLHAQYHAAGAGLYLIRPDGYIGYRSFPPQAARLADFLGRIFL